MQLLIPEYKAAPFCHGGEPKGRIIHAKDKDTVIQS